jgi:Na+/phosphate symporter
MVEKAFEGLMRHNRKILDEAQKIGDRVAMDSNQLIQIVLSAKESSSILSPATCVEISTEIQKIAYSANKMVNNIRKKIDEGVLFSDKALSELKDIFGAVINCLGTCHDLLLTKNPILVEHILRQTEKYDEITRKYAEEHQDRLIRGICLPKSSLIYLLVLESLKDILWYIKCIAKAFKGVI